MKIDKNSLILMDNVKRLKRDNPKLYIPYKWRWIKRGVVSYNGSYYYAKKVNNIKLINELLGTYLCRLIDLDAVNYLIACDDNYEFYAMSKLFYESGFKYSKPHEFGYTTHHLFDNGTKNTDMLDFIETLSPYLIEDFEKLIAIDLKMLQSDRSSSNIMFKKDSIANYELCPIYDFSEAYDNICDPYFNPFIIVWLNPKSLKKFVSRHPRIMESIDTLKKIKIEDALEDIAFQKGLEFSDEEIKFYKEKDEYITKLLKIL